MNGTEQRNHRTAVAQLEQETANAFAVIANRLDAHDEALAHDGDELRGLSVAIGQEQSKRDQAISAETTHRLELAREQRAYVDGQDRLLRQRIDAFSNRAFWSRLNWLLTGR